MRWCVLFLALVSTLACGSPSTGPTPPPPPVGAPSITCPANVAVNTTTPTTVVTYTAPVASGGSPPTTVSCTPASGATLSAGTTTAMCTVTDAIGQSAVCSFNITVTLRVFLPYTKMWAFGDSLTAGEVSNSSLGGLRIVQPLDSYPTVLQSLLAERYSQQTFTVTNKGLPAEAAADGADRLRASLIAGPVPEVLLLLEGSNEMVSQNDEVVGTIVQTLSIDIDEARNRGVKTVLLATFPPARAGSHGSKVLPYIVPVNTDLLVMAAGKGSFVKVVDLYTAMRGQEATLIGDDGLHPTVAGYRKMAETFFAALKSSFETTTPPTALFKR